MVYKSYLTGWQGRTTAEVVAIKTLKSTYYNYCIFIVWTDNIEPESY